MRILANLTALLVGCTSFGKVEEDSFAEQYAAAVCENTEECYTGIFYDEWDDIDDCVDDQLDLLDDLEDVLDDCEFDEDKAADCIDALRAVDCRDYADTYEDAAEDCAEVWECEGGVGWGGGDGGDGWDTGGGDGDTDVPADPVVTVSWGASSIRVSVTGVTPAYFGIAETNNCTDCWTGEDCLNGYDTGGTILAYCHPMSGPSLSLAYGGDPLALGEGYETLVPDSSFEGNMTYYLEASDGSCYTFGADPSYYDAAGCNWL